MSKDNLIVPNMEDGVEKGVEETPKTQTPSSTPAGDVFNATMILASESEA